MAAPVGLSAATPPPPGGQSAAAPTVRIALRSRALRQGEVVVATIATPAALGEPPVVEAFGQRWPAYAASAGRWRSLIGIDLETAPGEYAVTASTSGVPAAAARRAITVTARRFRVRRLKVAPQFVNPPPDVQARIVADAQLLRDAYAHPAAEPAWQDGFRRPVPGVANSSFGSRSVFNGERRNPHTGTDFLSPAGTPTHAPASGRVVVARDLFFTGNTIVIDHGLGVFSILAHFSRLDVHEGDTVTRGDVVGLVGATGRVTGPHLHWTLRVGNARVDPLSALALLPAR